MLRFRALNLVASLVLVVFNALLGIWPMVAMNAVLAGINLWFIRKLLARAARRHGVRGARGRADDAYLRHVLAVHGDDIRQFFPAFAGARRPRRLDRRSAFLVEHGDETVGVRGRPPASQEGVAQVELDYVTPRFRDFTPGEFVYRRSGLFLDRGYQQVRTPPGMVAPYYDRLGFRREGDHWTLDL